MVNLSGIPERHNVFYYYYFLYTVDPWLLGTAGTLNPDLLVGELNDFYLNLTLL